MLQNNDVRKQTFLNDFRYFPLTDAKDIRPQV